MSQVGWMPLAPTTPTTAVDNGDGTGTITNSDGTTVTVCLDCTDNNTWNEITIDASGDVTFQLTDASGPIGFPKVYQAPPAPYSTTESSADSVANATTANVGKALEADNLDWLLTNRAIGDGSRGLRNTDGTLGHFSRRVGVAASTGQSIPLDDNGSLYHAGVNSDGSSTLVIPPPQRFYQEITITFYGSLNVNASVELQFDPSALGYGIHRDNIGRIRHGSNISSMYCRAGETITLYALNGGVWNVKHYDHVQLYGNGWREELDGTITQEGFAAGGLLASNTSGTYTIPYNVAVTSSVTLATPIASIAASNLVSDRVGSVHILSNSATSTSIDFVLHNSTPSTINNSVYWRQTGGRLL